jgi:hypothetical protein
MMLPTKFQFIWESSFRGEDFLEINQSETRRILMNILKAELHDLVGAINFLQGMILLINILICKA